MYLVQILLPTADNEGKPYGDQVFADIQKRLTETFGGVTAYSRAPAKGVWSHQGKNEFDDIVIVEVMAGNFDRAWWQSLRAVLQTQLRQKQIVIRAQAIEIV
jgi:hypothetical protein